MLLLFATINMYNMNIKGGCVVADKNIHKGYNRKAIPLIEACYDKFTSVERVVADFFLTGPENRDFSSKAIAKDLFVSEASLSRFSQKCGFTGYRQFIFFYLDNANRERDFDALTRLVLNSYQKVLDISYSIIDNEQMVRIAQMLDRYDRVYVYGIGSSAIAAQEFKIRFMRLGLDVDYLAESHAMQMNITRITDTSLVIGISVSGRTEEVVQGLLAAHKKGAKTIMLSAVDVPEYRAHYDEFVQMGSLKNLPISDKISPQIPALIIVDVIYAHYLNYNKEMKQLKLNMTLAQIEYLHDE